MRFVMFCYPRFVYEKEMSLYSITVYALQTAFITTNGYAFGRHVHYHIANGFFGPKLGSPTTKCGVV